MSADFTEKEILEAMKVVGGSYDKALAYLRGESPTEEERAYALQLLEAQSRTDRFGIAITEERIRRIISATRRIDIRRTHLRGRILLDLHAIAMLH